MQAPNCLICDLNPLCRADFDGLCVSCRAAVADGLYKIEHAFGDAGGALPKERWYRCVTFATASEHILGIEFPNPAPDPIVYEPEKLPALWRALDREAAELARSQTVLAMIETGI